MKARATPPTAPPAAKKQRTIHDFFSQDSGKLTARKKKRTLVTTPVAPRTPVTSDGDGVAKRIDYDSPTDTPMQSNGAEEDEDSQGFVGSSQPSTPFTYPRAKKIDFSHYASQRSEPDVEPASRAQLMTPTHGAVFGGGIEHGTPGFSQRNSAYSQDDMDFLTPLDQPVMHLSHPTTPSPLKKRHRRSSSADLRDDDVQRVTNDMTHMDVRLARNPPPSFSTDSIPSPMAQDVVLSPAADATPLVSSFLANGKRKLPRPPRDEPVVMETFTNPFAPPVDVSGKKRPRRKRQSFPPAWIGAATGMSKYLSDFVEQEMIGSGSFSKVFKCLKKIDGWVYAVKKSKRHFRGKADTERALREVQALAALSSSRHIVRYFDAWIEDDLLYIQLEFCQGVSLAELVERFKPHPIPEATLCKILCHLAQALHDMHSRQMAHMDVKLQNVLLGDGDVYKLGDLGTVAHVDGSMEITEGDNRYLSRELLEGSRSNLRAGDVFALGATIYELALGRTLPANGEEWQRIRDGDLTMFRQYSNSLQHLIAGMMHPDPLQRPSAEEILQHEVVLPFHEPA